MNRRPLAVTLIGWLYIVVGAAGFMFHVRGFDLRHPFDLGPILVELLEIVALACGVYLLRGRNWARWGALAWIGFHVVLSAFHVLPELVVHSVFCAVLAYFLLRPSAGRYFRAART